MRRIMGITKTLLSEGVRQVLQSISEDLRGVLLAESNQYQSVSCSGVFASNVIRD